MPMSRPEDPPCTASRAMVAATNRTYSRHNAGAVVLRAESTAPHDPRLPELSVKPHVSHLSSVMPIPAIVLSLFVTVVDGVDVDGE